MRYVSEKVVEQLGYEDSGDEWLGWTEMPKVAV